MKRISIIMVLTAFVFVLTACGIGGAKQIENGIKVKDTNGTVMVPKNPKRIVVLDYGVLDSLDQLGESDRVVGLPRQKVPDYLKEYDNNKYTNVGSLKEIDLEKINSLAPDLIISSNRLAELNSKLKKIAPTVQFTVDEKNYMKSFKSNVSELAKIVGQSDAAEQELKKIDQKIDSLNAKIPVDNKSLTIITNEGKASAFGSKSRYGLINDIFGFPTVDSKIEASSHGQSVSMEYISRMNPDYLFVIDRSAVVTDKPSASQVVNNELVKKTSAYKNNHIVYLNPEVWYFAGGGLESMNIMIDEVMKGID